MPGSPTKVQLSTKTLATKEMVFGLDGVAPEPMPSGGPPGGRLAPCGKFFITPDGQWHPNPNTVSERHKEMPMPAAEPDRQTLTGRPPIPKGSDAMDQFMQAPSSRGSNFSSRGSERALLNSRGGSSSSRREPPSPATPTHDPNSAAKLQAIKMRQLGLSG
mmetsp:Transcript_28218/g.34235  ORF Transcript_28218/g.34235 Transcript_28218/m.34235 type:complete len:161 (-) Transcript_28218:363-845(-)|eukprot:CAMPEP_0197857454 /NCGR_PEP_ID=MMETSP1438-20131217/30544_1 /TAXON_ID=1461541 /ORGANISM="Pterosperma sp., Strain CCMP1384" /LENGTH=160 /DNA_ID=CAMNT_0043473289 /DNA_START=441 /DNA_END=923 /DNA_ORIENTATION=-